jgi:hypothetical protein
MGVFDFELLTDDDEVIQFTCGFIDAENTEGLSLLQKSYRLRGEVWQVHKGDADPYPSNPHAHCIEGRRFYEGLKLHLGTGDLYRGSEFTGVHYPRKDFLRLCEMIQPKFPHLAFPLAT